MQAWFRELPRGVLDSLSPEQVLASHGEKDSLALVKLLPATESALLNWAINLMADVVELESFNKMNARNIAMVFAPNMTQVWSTSAVVSICRSCCMANGPLFSHGNSRLLILKGGFPLACYVSMKVIPLLIHIYCPADG